MLDRLNIRIKRYNIEVAVPLVWLTYFPFIGWMYAFIFKKTDGFAMQHGKQAFILAIIFTAIPILLTFSTVFVPLSMREFRLTAALLVYASHLVYFSLCAWGFIRLKDGADFAVPGISYFAKKLDV